MPMSGCAAQKTRIIAAALVGAAVLTGTPAMGGTDSVSVYDDGSTPHGTMLENDMDPILIGTWTILQVQIEQSGQAIVFPSSGATLTILDSGSFKQDYSSESNGPRPIDIAAGDFVTTVTRSPVSTCKIEASGEIIGHLGAYWEGFGGTLDTPQLRVSIFPDASTRPQVRCAGSSEVLGNMVTPAIGMAPPSGTGEAGPFVAYSYIIDRDDFTDTPNAFMDLEIWTVSTSPVRTRYFLRKVD